MSQVQRIARNGMRMEGAAGENGELLSLRDNEDDGGGHGGRFGDSGGGGGGPGGYPTEDDGGGFERKNRRRSNSNVIVTSGRNDNCCEKILKCLGLIPCPSLLSWIVLLCGIGCLTGGLLIGTWRTRDLLDEKSLLWFMEYSIIGVVVGMFVVATLLMVTGHISSEPTSRRVFNSFKKNRCARGLNIFVLVVSYFMAVLWTLMTVVLSVPLVFIADLFLVDRDSFNPAIFGFSSHEYVDYELKDFKKKSENLLICYGVACFGAFLIVNSMIFFIMAISANITHLRDNRFATLNAYGAEEVGNSKHSVVDTNM